MLPATDYLQRYIREDITARMTFAEWLKQQPYGTAARIVRETCVSAMSVDRARRGIRLHNYDVARRISEATDGAVSIDTLCKSKAKPLRRSRSARQDRVAVAVGK